MSLARRVRVKTCYTRSTNVERDKGGVATVAAYCPTARGVALLEDVAAALGKDNQPRAWSLIGPYGSGKSTFAVFLYALLGSKDAASAQAAKVLGKQSRPLATRFRRQKAWCRVVLSGSPEPLSRRLLTALDDAATAFWRGRPGRKPRVLRDIHDACAKKQVQESHLLTLVDDLQDALERIDAGGLLFVIDELGKFLEFEARERTGNMGSTYLLQELAERTYLGRKANLMLFVLQHQSFDMYAAGMGEQLQNEWAKVQGRFQTVSFVETTEQTLRVLAAAFEHDFTELEQNNIHQWSANSARALAEANALPVGLAPDAAAQLFTACYPMHPVSLLALPVLCTRFAQNERTLFSYFGSNEPHGFQQAVERLAHLGERVHPCDIYDYFVQTQPPTLAAPLAQRTWAEVVTAVDRAERAEQEAHANGGDASGSLTALVKAVGLLNLTTGSQGLPATEAVLSQLFETKDAFERALAAPLAASILQYRKFADEYRVWQGTDFNIDEHIAQERDKLGRVELARTLTERGEITPIVARRHSIETGALRSFDVVYADAGSKRPKEGHERTPRLVFFLAEHQTEEAIFHAARKDAQTGEVWVLHPNGGSLRAAIVQVLALERVQQGAQEVASDPVAAREVNEQLKTAQTVEQQALNALLRDPAASQWYWGGKKLRISDRRTLQAALSNVMDSIYTDSPRLRNELINRDRLSSQAAAARNKLFSAMLNRADQPGLGIDKYPPERAIYRSVLERGGLHSQDESGDWKLAPPPEADELHLQPTWSQLDALFEASEAGPVSTEQLMEELAAPPIGLKRGIFPLIFLHYYLLNRHEIAFYDEGAYSPSLTYEHLERLVRRPDLFTFQRFRVAGVRATLFDEYSQAIFGKKRHALAVLDIARPLASFQLGLPEYTRKTRRLSKTTLRVREALTLAKSPEKLLFERLPEACGWMGQAEIAGFAETLVSAIRELDTGYTTMIDEMRKLLCDSFTCPCDTEIGELRSVAMGRCHGLDTYTVDVKGLKSFIRRMMEQDRSDEAWLEHVLTFLGQKPPSRWTDQDRSTAEYRLAEFSARLLDLQRLKLYYDGRGASVADGLDVILLKTLSREHGEIDETVPIDSRVAKAIAEARRKVEDALEEVGDDKLRLALVAAIAQDCLAERRRGALRPPLPMNCMFCSALVSPSGVVGSGVIRGVRKLMVESDRRASNQASSAWRVMSSERGSGLKWAAPMRTGCCRSRSLKRCERSTLVASRSSAA